MMKKTTLSILLLAALVTNAKSVSPKLAEETAAAFFKTSGIRDFALTPLTGQRDATRAVDESQPYYVFNASGERGFVIIGGDDRANSILGYSDSGIYNPANIPPQLKLMLEEYSVKCAALKEDMPRHSSWNGLTRADDVKTVLLPTAEWGQDYPYNTDCPVIGDVQCPTGCVATAMAIMMKYNKWPASYDWDSMPMTKPEQPVAALSKLMSDAGKAVYMNYGPSESGAQMAWVGNKLYSSFNYSPDCQYLYSRQFSEKEWIDMIKGSLDDGHPLIYSGTGSGSHAFIIDGYEGDHYHVNWGWDGACNGYFALDGLNPNEYSDFSNHTGMVLNIVPDNTGMEYSDCFVDYNLWAGGDVAEPMNISVENVTVGIPFHILQGSITIPAYFRGEVGIALVSADNRLKEILRKEKVVGYSEPSGRQFNFMQLTVTTEIDPTDRIQLVARNEGDENFKLMRGTLVSPSFISVSGNKPRYGKVRFDVGEGLKFTCGIGSEYDEQIGLGTLPAGKREVELLKGVQLGFRCDILNPNENVEQVLKANGPLIYGDMLMSGELNYSIDIAGEHDLTVKLVTLKDASFHLDQPGTLKDKITPDDANCIRDLTLSGKVDMNDLMYIRENMPCVRVLDMKDATIEACVATDDKFVKQPSEYFANETPSFGLVNLHSNYIEQFILPANLTSIGSDSMVNFRIEGISLPKGVTSIGLNAFYGNHFLQAVELLNPEPVAIADCVFVDTPCEKGGGFYTDGGKLYVPEGSGAKFRVAPVWKDFTVIEGRMPTSGVENVSDDATAGICDIFSLDGKPMLLNCPDSAIKSLDPGIYIVRRGSKSEKIAVVR